MNLNHLKNSIDVIDYLAETLNSVRDFSFVRYKSYSPIQDRIKLDADLYQSFQQALSLREKFKLPFWDSFNVSLFNRDFNDYSFFDQIQFHNEPTLVEVIATESVSAFLLETDLNSNLALSSRVTLMNGSVMHILLLDFHIPISSSNQKICENILTYLKLTGFLLDSGKSYHFIGDCSMDEGTLLNLLSRCLLFSPILDRAWIAHQLIQREARLRVSKKYSRQPIVVTYIG